MGTCTIGRYKACRRFLFFKLEDFPACHSEGLGKGKVQEDNRSRQPRRSISSRNINKQSLSLKVCSRSLQGRV
ncbi:hypothetical protein BTUAT1_17010 [Bacillus altitudinis]|nr:hypothetical protein BTUAT1_17010 [Bacillus pumilus]